MLKLPYAVSDFQLLIKQNFFYADRTDRIPLLEETGFQLLFLRPRRFGKSLWLSTLMNYYDVAQADQFEQLFGQLYIGQNPTPLHHQYLIMRWDFSVVRTQGTAAQIEQDLHQRINLWVSAFAQKYRDLLPVPIEVQPNALASFESAVIAASFSPYKIYLFIDEYDNFANEVMMQRGDQQRYFDLIEGEGILKTLFKNIKMLASGVGLERVFMTGVSPVALNDMTSGANVVEDMTWFPLFHDLCGFREDEVVWLIEQTAPTKAPQLLEQMRAFYNGSRFDTHSRQRLPRLYNPTLVFYFLRHIQRLGYEPEMMLDSNLAPDYNKLVYISAHPKGKQLIHDALAQTTITIPDLSERWGVRELLNTEQQRKRLAALLCYLGGLTVAGKDANGRLALEIPNLVMRKLYAERLLNLLLPSAAARDDGEDAAHLLFAQGNIGPLCAFIEQNLLSVYDNRDYRDFNELTLKTLFITLLHNNGLYVMDSEPALQRQYADLSLIIRPEMRQYQLFDVVLEFKYLPLRKLPKLTGQSVREADQTKLRQLSAVKTEFNAAHQQLQTYRQALSTKYGADLRLRTFVVVGLGLERILWEEVV